MNIPNAISLGRLLAVPVTIWLIIAAQIQAYVDFDVENLPVLKESLQEIRYSEAQLAEFRAKAGAPVIQTWIEDNQDRFDARGLVEAIFEAVGQTYPAKSN